MELFSGFKFSDIKNCDIIDKDGERVGRLIDAVFKPSGQGMELKKFVVGGSRFEEMMEDLGLKEDIDPVFPVDVIEVVTHKHIRLNCGKNDLKSTTIDNDAIEGDEMKLSQLSKFKLFDSTSDHIGNIMDLMFDNGAFQFIIGDGPFQEWAEDVGLIADVDFLLSPSYISSFGDNQIILSQNKVDLQKTFSRHITQKEGKEARDRATLAKSAKHMYFPIYR